MTLKQQMQTDLDDVFFKNDEFSEEITYQGTNLNAHVLRKKDIAEDSSSVCEEALLYIKKSDIPNDNESNHMEECFFDSVTWNVEHRESHDTFVEVVYVRRKEAYKGKI